MSNSELIDRPLPAHVDPKNVVTLPYFARTLSADCPHETLVPQMQAELGPITWVTNIFPGDQPGWLLTGVEDVQKMLRDPKNYTKKGMGQFAQSIGDDWLIIPTEADPPVHTAYRNTLNPHFAPHKMAAMRDDLRQRAIQLIDQFKDRGSCDLVNEFSERYPIFIVLDLLGLPQERMAEFLVWEKDMLHNPDFEVRAEAVRKVRDYLLGEIAERQARPRDDYMTRVLTFESDGRRWTDKEVLGHCFNLFLGGLDTVTAMLGNIFAFLVRNPERQQELRDRPELIVLAMEEMLRAYGVVTSFRIASTEHEIRGQKIMPGDYVSVATPIIGRDPTYYENADEIRFDRKAPHVSLGGGIHKCMGMHLARLELQIAVEEFLKAIPTFRQKEGTEILYYHGNNTHVHQIHLQWN